MEFQIENSVYKSPGIKGEKIQNRISRFAGIKKVISRTTLGLRSKKLLLAELPNSIRITILPRIFSLSPSIISAATIQFMR